jgi:hypothetical protein
MTPGCTWSFAAGNNKLSKSAYVTVVVVVVVIGGVALIAVAVAVGRIVVHRRQRSLLHSRSPTTSGEAPTHPSPNPIMPV